MKALYGFKPARPARAPWPAIALALAMIAGCGGGTTPVTTTADNGATFAVQVSNAYGKVTSSPAVLTVM